MLGLASGPVAVGDSSSHVAEQSSNCNIHRVDTTLAH